jgi:Raf kinase inhibitor-like YbhB/YbcL family protein
MLEKLPTSIGRALRRVRPGINRIAANRDELGGSNEAIVLESASFLRDERIPVMFTADGDGISPPLRWSKLPERTASLALIVEDADSPTPMPLVHAIVANLLPDGELVLGAIGRTQSALVTVGKNSFLKPEWLPPDPPRGHGIHRYAFQLFALDTMLNLPEHPGRNALLAAIKGHILGRDVLIGTYSRD